MGTPRHLTAAVAALLTLGLVGCTDDSPDKDATGTSTKDGSRTTVEMTEVKGTEALRPKTTVVGGWATVVSGTKGAVLAELTGSDGKPTQLYVVDPRTRSRTALDVTAPVAWEEAANDKTAVIAGDVSEDHKRTPFVRASSDLKTWQDVPISYPGKGWSFSEVGLDGDVPLVIAAKPDGSKVLMRRDGDGWSTHDIPAARGQEISPIGLVEHRGELVLLATEGKRGGESITRVLTSADGGRTWTRGAMMAGARGSYGVAGIVSTGTHLVATGWADRKAPMGTQGMLWTSTDGATWKRRPVSTFGYNGADMFAPDYHTSAPTVIGGRATFDVTCDSCTEITRMEWSGSGRAKSVGEQLDLDQAEPDSGQLPGKAAGVLYEGGSLVYFAGRRTRTLVKGEADAAVSSIEAVGDSAYVAHSHGQFTREANGWNVRPHIQPFVLKGRLTQQEWRPKALSSWTDVATASDSRGKTTVAVGTSYDRDFQADARALTDGSWHSPKGLGRHDFESTTDVTHVAGRFLMSLQVAADSGLSTTRTARVYSSTDGVAWREEDGRWSRSAKSGTAIDDVCQLPDGSAFTVGASQADPNARSEATTWTRSKGGWKLAIPEIKGEGANFDSCATTDGTTVVSGSVNGDDIEWTTTDGKAFRARKPLPRGVSRGTPHEVEGGLVASGYLNTKEHMGPVVWFSKNGKAWQWAPVDVDDISSTVSVLPAGNDVYAIVAQASGDRIWTIDEIATTKVTGDEG